MRITQPAILLITSQGTLPASWSRRRPLRSRAARVLQKEFRSIPLPPPPRSQSCECSSSFAATAASAALPLSVSYPALLARGSASAFAPALRRLLLVRRSRCSCRTRARLVRSSASPLARSALCSVSLSESENGVPRADGHAPTSSANGRRTRRFPCRASESSCECMLLSEWRWGDEVRCESPPARTRTRVRARFRTNRLGQGLARHARC